MPTNREDNLSRTKVEESKGSKEFQMDDPEMTVALAHAVRVLEAHFKQLGYDEWILGPVCSRKLLEKVQQRMPNPQYIGTMPAPIDQAAYLRRLQEQLATTPVGQWVIDPQPTTGAAAAYTYEGPIETLAGRPATIVTSAVGRDNQPDETPF